MEEFPSVFNISLITLLNYCRKKTCLFAILNIYAILTSDFGPVQLFTDLYFIGQIYYSEIPDVCPCFRDFQWQHILSLYNRSNQPGNESHNKQILYTTTVLFLECLYHYISSVDTDVFHTGQFNINLCHAEYIYVLLSSPV